MRWFRNTIGSNLVRKYPKVSPTFGQYINHEDFQIEHPDLITEKAEAVSKSLKDTLKNFDDFKNKKRSV